MSPGRRAAARLDSPHEGETLEDGILGGEDEDGDGQTDVGDQSSRASADGEDDDRADLGVLIDGGGDGAGDGSGGVGFEFDRVGDGGASGVAGFGAANDVVHHRDDFNRVTADGGLGGEHEGVGAVPDGVGDVGGFGAGRSLALDHGFEHLGGDDDGQEGASGGFDDAPLEDGNLGRPGFDAEVAAGDHDAIGDGDDLLQFVDGGEGFDLGDEGDFAAGGMHGGGGFGQIAGAADEREGEEVEAVADGEADVLAILSGHGGQAHAGAGRVESGASGEQAAAAHGGANAIAVNLLDEQVEFAVAQVDAAADFDLIDEGGVGTTDGQAVAIERGVGVAADDDVDRVAAGDLGGVGDGADADLGALEVAEDGDRFAGFGLGAADGLDGLRPGVVRRRGRS